MAGKKKYNRKTVEDAGMGREPVFAGEVDKMEMINALNWYAYSWDKKKSAKALAEYLKEQGEKEKVKAVRALSDDVIVPTYGNLAKMMSNGAILPESYQKKFNDYIDILMEKYQEKKAEEDEESKEEDSKPQYTVQDHIQFKADDISSKIDVVIDEFIKNGSAELNTYEFLAKEEAKPVHASKVAEEFRPMLDELKAVKEGKDKDLTEGYSNFKPRQLTKLIKFVESIVNDCESYATNKKKTRATKKKKPRTKSVTKQIEKLKYKPEDIDLKLASVPPEKIVGAQQLWVYNTKQRKLTVLNAMNRDGFSIKGTTVQNFDPDTSESKSVRKPEETTKRVLDGGKRVLNKLMGELTTKSQEAKGRINEDTILLRVE